MTLLDSTVTVWTTPAGVPSRVVWEGRRYRVSDSPTRLEPDYELITHPPLLNGWRFQGTSDDGESRVFDVLFSESRQEWRLLRVYL
jgi:hypothetical protein